MEGTPDDSRLFREVLGHCPTAVAIIAAPRANGPPVGMVVGSFLSVSLDPPLCAFFPATTSGTWSRIAEAGKFCASILAHDQGELCRRFVSSRRDEKFRDVDCRMSQNGSPIVEGCLAYVDCDIDKVVEAGDHFFVTGLVKDLAIERSAEPLLFFQGRYRSLAPGRLDDPDVR